MDTCGFLSRAVDDLDTLLDVFQVTDDDPVPEQPFQLRGAKIAFARTSNWSVAGPGMRAAMEKAHEILLNHEAVIEDIDLPNDFSKVLDWHLTVRTAEGKSSFLGQYRTDKTLLHEDLVGFVENKSNLSRKNQLEAYDSLARLRPIWDEIASKYDVVITPSVPDEAPLGLENTGDMVCRVRWKDVSNSS